MVRSNLSSIRFGALTPTVKSVAYSRLQNV
jgi:hypothetical protein